MDYSCMVGLSLHMVLKHYYKNPLSLITSLIWLKRLVEFTPTLIKINDEIMFNLLYY